MRIIQADMPGLPSTAPVFLPESANEKLVRLAGASVWLEGDDKYIATSSGVFSGWMDRVAGRLFVPAAAASPILPSLRGGKRALQMGFGTGLSVAANGALKAADNADLLPTSGRYTIAYVARLPTTTGGETTTPGGNIYGSAVTVSGSQQQMRANFGYASSTLNIATNNAVGSSLVYSSGGFLDATYHSVVISVAPTATAGNQVIRKDGAASYTAGVATGALSTATGARKLLIGAAGSAADSAPLIGNIGLFILIPDVAVHLDNAPALAALEAIGGAYAATLNS